MKNPDVISNQETWINPENWTVDELDGATLDLRLSKGRHAGMHTANLKCEEIEGGKIKVEIFGVVMGGATIPEEDEIYEGVFLTQIGLSSLEKLEAPETFQFRLHG